MNEMPPGLYDVILADPPWQYDFSKSSSRDIENHYDTMSLVEIKNLKVPAKKNAVLFLWATAPKLLEALEVMEAWGFKYKTQAVWDKKIIGMGYWFRGQHEILLVGVKGKVSPPVAAVRVSSVLSFKRQEHSKKPEFVYNMIESYFPSSKYLELFARHKRVDWSSWGNEIENCLLDW